MEDMLNQVGHCGRFQLLLFPMSMASVSVSVGSMLFMVFGAVEPDWWCLSRDFSSNSSTTWVGEVAVESWADLNGSRALQYIVSSAGNGTTEMGNSTYKRCEAVQNQDGGGCERIVFSSGMSTIVSEFRLVCDLAWVPSLTISMQMVGVLLGASIAGQMADNLGRKKTMVGVISLHSLFNLVAAFSVSWQMFTAMRALIGLTVGGILAASFAYPTEFIGAKWRSLAGTVPVWGIGAFAFSLLVWALPNWYHIHIAITICSTVCLLPWLFLPESVRYLSVRGQVTKAERALRKVARWNNRKCPSLRAIQRLHTDTGEERKNYHLLHLFSSWEITKLSFLNGLMWFCASLSYYGISFGIKNFSGNFYYNFMLLSCVEVPPCLLVYPFCRWFGRRYTVSGSLAISGLSVLAGVPVVLLLPEGETGMIINGLCMVARMSLNLGWNAMTVFLAELMPTVVRNTGIGFCNTTARVGGILAPYILVSDEPYVFYVIVGVSMLAASIAPLFLRETRGQPLVDELPVKWKKNTKGSRDLNGYDRELEAL